MHYLFYQLHALTAAIVHGNKIAVIGRAIVPITLVLEKTAKRLATYAKREEAFLFSLI